MEVERFGDTSLPSVTEKKTRLSDLSVDRSFRSLSLFLSSVSVTQLASILENSRLNHVESQRFLVSSMQETEKQFCGRLKWNSCFFTLLVCCNCTR